MDRLRSPSLAAQLREREQLRAQDVLRTLGRHLLLDGYDFVLDLDASRGRSLVDAVTGTSYLDFFSFFASSPLGVNHPALADDEDFLRRLARAAVNKPSNADVYTVPYATFVDRFVGVLGDPALPHLFFIDGGALAVENALKAAFDWKARRSGYGECGPQRPLAAMHLTGAFHGRSGYTLSLTNTEPRKTALFPTFDWPRIATPVLTFPVEPGAAAVRRAEVRALTAATEAFESQRWSVACFIAEPVQGEGGDRHMRPEFLQAIAQVCRRYDALFVLDEVQTGCGLTGTAWAYQQLGLAPDLVAFGKKTQVCGVMAGRRLDEVAANVFRVPSRISSTWGGNLADMVRATRILEVIEAEGLFAAAAAAGEVLLAGLHRVAAGSGGLVTNVRGRGLMCALDLPTAALRDSTVDILYRRHHVLVLPCGQRSLRFRPPLTVLPGEIDRCLEAVDAAVAAAREPAAS